MGSEDFQKLVKRSGYQVFLFTCPSTMPFNFATHPWFICVKNGEASRWEILFRKNKRKTNWDHLHLNFLAPFMGMEIIPFFGKYHGIGNLVGHIEGNENSTAKKIIDFIENSKETYPYCHKYFPTGPNSNTYAQWVLNHFPEFKLKLPWNSFGKHY